jgi:thiol-disulfide isomerase/thioredoxin
MNLECTLLIAAALGALPAREDGAPAPLPGHVPAAWLVGVSDGPFADLPYEAALTRAKEQEKLLFVDFTASWCGPCKKMDADTWRNAEVGSWLAERAIAVQVDVDQRKDLARQFGVEAMPTVVVLRGGQDLARRTGYQDAAGFLAWAQGVAAGTLSGDATAHAQDSSGAGEAREEMIQLFHRVERRLAEIDALLYDASTGQPSPRAGLATVAEAGIGELLQRSEGESQVVLQDIDRILEIARQFGQSQSSGGSCESALQGSSPLDQKPGSQGQKEQTPEMMEGGQQRPEPPGQREGGQPDSPRESVAPEDSENRDTPAEPPAAETGRVEVQDSAERWGDLPEHVRDLFRTEGGRDMPPQYRDWIDGYYRRLNRRP